MEHLAFLLLAYFKINNDYFKLTLHRQQHCAESVHCPAQPNPVHMTCKGKSQCLLTSYDKNPLYLADGPFCIVIASSTSPLLLRTDSIFSTPASITVIRSQLVSNPWPCEARQGTSACGR
eukprot:scpid65377/ scgid19922/ 